MSAMKRSLEKVIHRETADPREIDVHIEELVLHGFDPHSRWSVADALENQLRGLLAERGLPAAWLTNPERLMIASNPSERIGEAVYRGGVKS
ncbi:MAG: hypothetical protein ABI680_15995 [Chthoniobacteraceae bacterium]